MLGVYAAAGVSGAHLNPAVTRRARRAPRFPVAARCPPTSLAQIAGAFVASAVVFLTYREAFDAFDGGVRQVQGATGHRGHLRHLSAAVSVDRRRVRRSDRRHRAADGGRAGGHRSAERRPPGVARRRRSSACWSSHRRRVRLQRRLRDQPGARLRAAPVHRGGGMGRRRVHGWQRLVVGADCRPDASARCRARVALRRVHRRARCRRRSAS